MKVLMASAVFLAVCSTVLSYVLFTKGLHAFATLTTSTSWILVAVQFRCRQVDATRHARHWRR